MQRRGRFMATYHDGRKCQNEPPSVEADTLAGNGTDLTIPSEPLVQRPMALSGPSVDTKF